MLYIPIAEIRVLTTSLELAGAAMAETVAKFPR
jgi:hypothetical protein